MPGTAYQVESRGGLTSGSWTNLSENIVAAGATTSYTNAIGGGAPMKLYRVKTVPSP
jgi:hypothetical protein